jgi:4-amino-4-deoxy-L-arabinose transferase-like glycosyltransferase
MGDAESVTAEMVSAERKETIRLHRLTAESPTWLAPACLGAIVLLGAYLRFYRLGAFNIGNTYYAAAIQSMLGSWHNFFYAAFEPGGSVSVDKTPLGLWIQVLSASLLGVNGFALALPQALAGVLSILLLYKLVKRPFGVGAGFVAALVLAGMPVTIATERNNTMDGTLLFVLLLATWAVLIAARDGRTRYLLLGASLVGVGFNIKMLQAYLVLPSLCAVYLFGSSEKWSKKVLNLSAATIVMLIVSLVWVTAVDLTPAAERPYAGSSTNNSMFQLIYGHNGLQRFGLSGSALVGIFRPAGKNASPGPGGPPAPGFGSPPGMPPGPPTGGGPGVNQVQEIGLPGPQRLFVKPLAEEASWLLPFTLLGLVILTVILGWKRPYSEQHQAVLLWGTWLLTLLVYFSFTPGLWHTYYLIMLGPPIAALTAATAWALSKLYGQHHWIGWGMIVALTGITAAYQIVTIQQYPEYAPAVTGLIAISWLAGILILSWRRPAGRWNAIAATLLFTSLCLAPLTLSLLTTFNTHPDVALPNAGPDQGPNAGDRMKSGFSKGEKILLDYLLVNTAPGSYLVATYEAQQAAPYILATKRPVMAFGGFIGSDNVIGITRLAQMVADGQLRFVLGGQQEGQKADIAAWVKQNCQVIDLDGFTTLTAPSSGGSAGPPGIEQGPTLYDCGIH